MTAAGRLSQPAGCEAQARLEAAASLRTFTETASLRTFTETTRPGVRAVCLRQSARGTRGLFLLVLIHASATEAGNRSVASRAAVPSSPYEQSVGPAMAVRATHSLVHQQPALTPKRSIGRPLVCRKGACKDHLRSQHQAPPENAPRRRWWTTEQAQSPARETPSGLSRTESKITHFGRCAC